MRRQGEGVAFEIVVRAPTLGLATRTPTNQSNTPSNQAKVRASSAASNVRFDQGVARNAEGYLRLITDPILDKPTFLFFQGQVSQNGRTLFPAIIGTQDKIWSVLRLPTDYVPPTCYTGDPLPDAPIWDYLIENVEATSADVYGLQQIDAVRRETTTTLRYNWRICDNIDYCDGPDEEGESQETRYTERWVVQPNASETGYEYGISGGTLIPVPAALFTGVDQTTITTISICFDGNARPVFAYQTAAGTLTLTRFVAGTPTVSSYSGDWPNLFYNGVVQRDTASRDVVLFYVLSSSIKTRFQRENFGVEREFFSAPDIIPVKITKTDRSTVFQNLYYIDAGNRLRLARSTPYPPFPIEASDLATSRGSPAGGEYVLTVVDGGAYSEEGLSIAAPAGGDYVDIVVTEGPYADETTNAAAPAGGDYDLVVIDGGTYSEECTSLTSPAGGEYVEVVVPGGNYDDQATSSGAPAGGSYD